MEPLALTSDLDPIIVTAPVLRCGTTLLQRLICSAPNALIFGETAGTDLITALGFAMTKRAMYTANHEQFADALDAVMNGEMNEWLLDLMPDLTGYLQALLHGCLAPIAYCRDFAARARREVWGIKFPGFQPQMLDLIRGLLRNAPVLYIHRDVVACLKSARAYGSVSSRRDVVTFCRNWVVGMRHAQTLKDARQVLVLSYEELVADPETHVRSIEKLTGARDIDRGIFARRINTWSGTPGAGEGGTYIPPAELSDEEMAIALEARSDLVG